MSEKFVKQSKKLLIYSQTPLKVLNLLLSGVTGICQFTICQKFHHPPKFPICQKREMSEFLPEIQAQQPSLVSLFLFHILSHFFILLLLQPQLLTEALVTQPWCLTLAQDVQIINIGHSDHMLIFISMFISVAFLYY